MKKIFFLITVMSLSVITFAQKNPLSGKNNVQTEESSSISQSQIETKRYSLNIEIENGSIIEDLVLRSNDNFSKMYLSGNWGTIDENKKVTFSKDIKSNTVAFIVAYRVIKVDDLYKLYEDGKSCKNMKEFISADVFKDVFTKKILVQAEFINSFGELVKKDLEINFEKNSSPSGSDIFATAKITNEDLGLNVISLKVDVQKLLFKFSLKNDEYGVSLVVDPKNSKKTTKVSVLAGKAMPDGIYSFICRMGLPNGIQKEEIVEAFVVNNEISLDNSNFNPLVFANGDYGKATVDSKTSLVKIRNTRSTVITVFIPTSYLTTKGDISTNKSTDIATEAFSDNGVGWKAYTITPGGSVKVKINVGIFPIIVYDVNRQTSDIIQTALISSNSQNLILGWGPYFTIRR